MAPAVLHLVLLLLSSRAGDALQLLTARQRPTQVHRAVAPRMDAAELNKLKATLQGLREDGIAPEALAPLEVQIGELEARLAAAPPPPPPPPPTRNAAELANLRATLKGLAADGFPPEALAPLETQIAELEAKVAAESTLPPLSAEQRRILDLCDDVEQEARRSDDDAPKRQMVRRQERGFLLNKLLDADANAYLELMPILSERGLTASDYPMINGQPIMTADAIDARLAAAAAARAQREADAAAAAARDAAVGAAEREREAVAAEMSDGQVSIRFAEAFLISEEVRAGVEHKVVGERMWSDVQQTLRLKSFRSFLERLLEGKALEDALVAIGREDPLARPIRDEVALAKKAAASFAPSKEEQVAIPPTIEQRFQVAWSEKAKFVYEWAERIPQAAAGERRVNTDGLSAVGKMRAQGPASDSMSAKAEKLGDRDPTRQLNERFNKLIDDLNK